MTDSHAEDDYARHLAEAIDRNARDIDRLCTDRLKNLSDRLSAEQEPYPREHLTTLRRPIHFLALQSIDPHGHPSMHPQAGGRTEPYRDRLATYFEVVEDINEAIERAVESGELVVRKAMTGRPMQPLPARASEPAKPFCVAIRNAEALRSHVFHDAAKLLLDLPLLDHLPHEGVAVRLAELDEWAARAGLAEAGEVTRLLQEAGDRMWEGELPLHAALEREAQDTELDEATRGRVTSKLRRLRALAEERGRLPAAVNDAAAEPEGTDPPPDSPPAAAPARAVDGAPLADVAAATDAGQSASLKMGVNDKASTNAYIVRRANEIYAEGRITTKGKIAELIAGEMRERGYSSASGIYLSAATVVKVIPTGMTGGRKRNGKKRG